MGSLLQIACGEDGSASIDWVVLSAAAIALALGVVAVFEISASDQATMFTNVKLWIDAL